MILMIGRRAAALPLGRALNLDSLHIAGLGSTGTGGRREGGGQGCHCAGRAPGHISFSHLLIIFDWPIRSEVSFRSGLEQ